MFSRVQLLNQTYQTDSSIRMVELERRDWRMGRGATNRAYRHHACVEPLRKELG